MIQPVSAKSQKIEDIETLEDAQEAITIIQAQTYESQKKLHALIAQFGAKRKLLNVLDQQNLFWDQKEINLRLEDTMNAYHNANSVWWGKEKELSKQLIMFKTNLCYAKKFLTNANTVLERYEKTLNGRATQDNKDHKAKL